MHVPVFPFVTLAKIWENLTTSERGFKGFHNISNLKVPFTSKFSTYCLNLILGVTKNVDCIFLRKLGITASRKVPKKRKSSEYGSGYDGSTEDLKILGIFKPKNHQRLQAYLTRSFNLILFLLFMDYFLNT